MSLTDGVFGESPPWREVLSPWGPFGVLSVFHLWPVGLPLSGLMWKGALLMALVSAKRALDPASLLSGTNHFQLEVDVIRFSPFRLYLGTAQVLFAPFQCQNLERGLKLLPSGDCEAHPAEKRTFASYAQHHLL
jgi:hypothetical protein